MKMSAQFLAAFALYVTIANAQWEADPKGNFVSVQGVVNESSICFSVGPDSKATYFGVSEKSWELYFINSDTESYTFQIKYLVDDTVIESIEKTVTRGKSVDFQIPRGQRFRAFFSSLNPNSA